MIDIVSINRTIFKNYPNGQERYGYTITLNDGEVSDFNDRLTVADMMAPADTFFDNFVKHRSQLERDMLDAVEIAGFVRIDGQEFSVGVNDYGLYIRDFRKVA